MISSTRKKSASRWARGRNTPRFCSSRTNSFLSSEAARAPGPTAALMSSPRKSCSRILPSGPIRNIAGMPIYAIQLRHRRLRPVAKKALDPFDFVFPRVIPWGGGLFVQTQADHDEPAVLPIRIVSGFQMGRLPDTGAAPGRPKIQQHIFAAKIRQLQRMAVNRLDLKIWRGVAGLQLFCLRNFRSLFQFEIEPLIAVAGIFSPDFPGAYPSARISTL